VPRASEKATKERVEFVCQLNFFCLITCYVWSRLSISVC